MSDKIKIVSNYAPSSDKIEIIFDDGTPVTIYLPIVVELDNVTIKANKKDYEDGETFYYIEIYDGNGYLIKEERFSKKKISLAKRK